MSKFATACFIVAREGYNGQTILLISELFGKSLDNCKDEVAKAKKLLGHKVEEVATA